MYQRCVIVKNLIKILFFKVSSENKNVLNCITILKYTKFKNNVHHNNYYYYEDVVFENFNKMNERIFIYFFNRSGGIRY